MKDSDLTTLLLLGLVIFLLLSNRQGKATVSNKEEWHWTDWQGRERNMWVHRDVQAS